jgi:Ca2+-binding RTX toxin-like protein
MTVAVPNSAIALNDHAWANLFSVSITDGLHFSLMPSPIAGGRPNFYPLSAIGSEEGDSTVAASDTASTESPPSDPIFAQQWHFDWLGDIQKIWDEYTGTGVHVGVYDDGVQSDHPDLAVNYDAALEVYVRGERLDANAPIAGGYGGEHGTAVAGLIAAARNGVDVVGVAYGSSVTGVPIFSGAANINGDFTGFLEALGHASQFDIVSNSWGAYPAFFQAALEENGQMIDGWMEAVETGRNGLGTIVTKAAGNENMNSNGDTADTSRATIIVGAYDATGDASWYSSFGVNLLVSAPSSGDRRGFFDPPDVHIDPGLVTTDITGPGGYNISNADFGAPYDYTDQFGGTSGATPIVSGVVALMLNANANLGWRDVQNILAYSAREVGSGVGGTPSSSEEHVWFYNNATNWNGGGLHYSADYGFGAIDAFNAVRMAEVWGLFAAPQASANETSLSSTLSSDTAINDLTNTDIKFDFSGNDFEVEYVNIDLDIAHSSSSAAVVIDIFGGIEGLGVKYLADLSFTLISPDGTVVEVADFNSDFIFDNATGGVHLTLGVNAFRGEDANGTWTLRISDKWFGGDAGLLSSATVTIHGRDNGQGGNDLSNDVYHYTNEVLTTLAKDGSRQTLTDTGGAADWLDMAAMSGNLAVNLASGTTSVVDGNAFLTIAAGTDIENAVTGDGNDTITGNALANKLYGMRGNDTLVGGAGNDLLSGGAGHDTLEGGADQDVFLFDRALGASNVDIIVDFSHVDDAIWLDSSIFNGLALGTLTSDLFYVIGSGTYGNDDRIVYDASLGALYFDADGAGTSSAMIQFAILATAPSDLSFDDFTVVAASPLDILTAGDRTPTSGPTVETSAADREGAGTIIGTEASETLRGDAGDNEIYGKGGEDIIFTGMGNNFVDGGAGLDTIIGGDGNDTLIGGGAYELAGDSIVGGGGDDLLIGSDDGLNDETWRYLGGRGDNLVGGTGNDKLYGLNGDDVLSGGDGDDLLVGGAGSDQLNGGAGNDRLLPGIGQVDYVSGGDGIDTLVLSGARSEYRFFMVDALTPAFGDQTVYIERTVNGVVERTGVFYDDIEFIEFADQTTDISRPLVDVIANEYNQPTYDPIVREFNGYEIGSVIDWADDVTIVDNGAENGTRDMLQTASIEHTYGSVDISSDALTLLKLMWLGDYGGPFTALGEMTGTVTVHAAAGERELTLKSFGLHMGADAKIIDNTATTILLISDPVGSGSIADTWNGAHVNDYNLSFAAATSFVFDDVNGGAIKWYIPNVKTITAPVVDFRPIVHLSQYGQQGVLTIETPLDDVLLATAGGDSDYSFSGGIGSELIRFGNLGLVNMSNDGTQGEEAGTNVGRGLSGTINLGAGDDEARILGAGAFKDGGVLDGGLSDFIFPSFTTPTQTEVNGDTIRMTFAVAAAIGNISDHIQNFENLQLDLTNETGQEVDVANFDNLSKLRFSGASQADIDNSVVGVLNNTDVTIRSVSEPVQNVDGWGGFLFTTYGNEFGNLNLDLAGDASDDVITLHFVGLATDGEDHGTIHIADAETVHITTDSRDTVYHDAPFDPNIEIPPLSYDPTDAFAQVLDLDATTSITLTGNTGWDFTVAGTDIGNLTSLDASGVTTSGAVGAVIVAAQTTDAVTFTGGAGDDQLTGNAGNDTLKGNDGNDVLDGGDGTDIAVFSGAASDYTVTDNGDGSYTIVHSGSEGSDTLRGIELLQFSDGLYTLDLELQEPPTDILPDEASVAENSADDTLVATLSAEDLNTGESFTFALIDSAGGRFKIIDGNKLVVADSTGLDYEAATEHTVTVRVTDSAGNTLVQDITINVTDVAENTAATVSLANMRTSIAENTSTAQRIKVADIVVNDDGVGTNTLGLVGRNAALFEIIGMALFLKAGVALDARTMTTLDVAVTVDDDTIDGTPDHTSSTYKLAVADVAGVTVINGNSGNNTLTGTSGNDYFDGHGGSDTFKGGKGNDVYVVDSAGDKVIEAAGHGTDTVHASVSHTLATNVEYLMLQGTGAINGTGNASNNLLVGNSGNNTLAGGAGNDRLYGGAGNDTLDGGTGNDRLFGQDGNDTLLGGTGDDRLDGGIGRDVLRGGTGKDVFVFNEVSESAVGSARDVITDFMRGQDKIDLSAIDAREATAANDAFTWFGTKAFTGAAGQLRFNDLGAEVFVQGDVDGDGVADFEIHVKVATVAASDFIL